jgi:predicted nucleic acid-binding Zn ribbon protein
MTGGPRPEEPRHCIKCGREVGADESICELCNRAGMATPSATQYHGTVVVAIVLAVAALAVAASLSLRGVGPYGAEIVRVEPREPIGYAITYAVTNEGTRPGRAKCQLIALAADGRRLRSIATVTSQIAGGASAELTESVPGLEVEPDSVTISCS